MEVVGVGGGAGGGGCLWGVGSGHATAALHGGDPHGGRPHAVRDAASDDARRRGVPDGWGHPPGRPELPPARPPPPARSGLYRSGEGARGGRGCLCVPPPATSVPPGSAVPGAATARSPRASGGRHLVTTSTLATATACRYGYHHHHSGKTVIRGGWGGGQRRGGVPAPCALFFLFPLVVLTNPRCPPSCRRWPAAEALPAGGAAGEARR